MFPIFYNSFLVLKRLEMSINGVCSVYLGLTGSQNQLKVICYWTEGFKYQHILDPLDLSQIKTEDQLMEYLINIFNGAYRKEIEKKGISQ